MANKGGFSWKRALGITKAKNFKSNRRPADKGRTPEKGGKPDTEAF